MNDEKYIRTIFSFTNLIKIYIEITVVLNIYIFLVMCDEATLKSIFSQSGLIVFSHKNEFFLEVRFKLK